MSEIDLLRAMNDMLRDIGDPKHPPHDIDGLIAADEAASVALETGDLELMAIASAMIQVELGKLE